jgi:homoserine dehydrogenase
MVLKLAFIGFGNVARALSRILDDRRGALAAKYDLRWEVTAVATATHGCITSDAGIDLLQASACVERGGNLDELSESIIAADALSVIKNCDADVMLETMPLNPVDGEPAVTYIRNALLRKMHVVTANKGPIAFAYSDLKSLAANQSVSFRYEATVMDGAPVFNLVERCLPGVRVLGFSGALNSTTNLILTGLETGQTFGESLAEARHRGIAEANADYDIDGWDAAVKATALANVLMTANVSPSDVERQGIRNIDLDDVRDAVGSGNALRLIARGKHSPEGVKLTVAPERVPIGSALGSAVGTSNVLVLETDLMGEIAIFEHNPGVDQTAYGLLSDLIHVRGQL